MEGVKARKDEWTDTEREMLTLCVTEGKTQGKKMKEIFEEAEALLGRTAVACSWLWYAQLNPDKGVSKTERQITVTESTTTIEITPADINNYLESILSERGTLREQVIELKSQLLVEQVKRQEETTRLQARLDEMEGDFTAMMRMLEKARRMTFVESEHEPVALKPHFRMDQNGNLERM